MLSTVRRFARRFSQEGTAGLITEGRQTGVYLRRRFRFKYQRLRNLWKGRRVSRWKENRTAAEERYNPTPRVSFVVQSFNRRQNVAHLASHLPADEDAERIVCEDGSIDGSLSAWAKRLTRRNDVIIRTNDLHDVRAYAKAMRVTNADVVCLLQDDDTLPDHRRWVDQALAFFNAYPDLAMVGAYSPVGLRNYDDAFEWQPFGDRDVPDLVNWNVEDGEPFPLDDDDHIGVLDERTGHPLAFVAGLGLSPIFIRRDAFDDVGGFDHGFSEPGESAAQFFPDLCMRCWKSGYRVGFFTRPDMHFNEYTLGGTELFQPESIAEQERTNADRVREKHREDFDDIAARIREANEDVRVVDPETADPDFSGPGESQR